MNFPRIEIRTTPLKLGMRTSPSKMEMETGNPNSLDLHTEPGKLEIHQEHIKVEIDQSQCFEEAGLKSNASLIAESASLGMQKSMETIGKIVDQGNQLAAIESGQDPIPEQAEYNAYGQFFHEWNIGFLPTSRPEFKVTGGTVDINYKPAKVVNDTPVKKVHFNYTKSKLDIYVEQYNSIEMSVVDLKG